MVTWVDTYKILAEEIDATVSDRPNTVDHIKNALLALVDLTSSESVSIDTYGTEIETYLLDKMNKFYLWGLHTWWITEQRKNIVNWINNITEKYYGNLTDFVNNISWNDGCVPYYWGIISEEVGYDTSEWTICS